MAPPKTGVDWTDINDPTVQAIIDLKKTRASLRTIRDFFDGIYSHETIRKGILKIQSSFGKRICAPDKKEWTIPQIALKLKRTPTLIASICSSGDITGCRKQGNHDGARWLIAESGLKELKQHPLISKRRECIVCGRKFRTDRLQTCSKKCSQAHATHLRSRLIQETPAPETLHGKALRVWKAIKRCSEKTSWLTIGEAAKKTNLTDMQVRWYVMRGIITSKENPNKRSGRGGKGVTLCALNQVKVMARILAS